MSEKEYDFMVGFTIFTHKGFKTMYRHFSNLETAKMFASNKNIKDTCKIYVDLDLYNKEKEKNAELEVKCQMQEYRINVIDERELISKDKIRKLIQDKRYKGRYDYETIRVSDLEELLKI